MGKVETIFWRLGAIVALGVLLVATVAGVQQRAIHAQEPVVLTVAAAADLMPALEELGELFTAQTDVDVDFTFGSTGQLAQQIEAGAPVDVFAAASTNYIDQLAEKGLIVPDTRALYARGRIVLWTQPDNTLPSVRHAVPLNLAVSIVTIAASLAIRSRSLSLAPVAPFTPAILALIAGAVAAAIAGTALFGRLSDAWLERTIIVLLLVIGIALIVEGVLPQTERALLPEVATVWVVAGVLFGIGIGLVSSLLGVAGGEVIIPTLIFAYGVDIKTAGTASLLISFPTVAVGIARYARRGAYSQAAIRGTVVPMGVGSVLGAVIGGLLVGAVPGAVLKLGLGLILIASAWRTFRHSQQPVAQTADAPAT